MFQKANTARGEGGAEGLGAGLALWAWFGASCLLVAGAFWHFLSERYEPRPPVSRFEEVTAAAGIDFRHNNGAAGENLLPERMGSGVAFLDYDRDGDEDLFFVNSTYWPWEAGPGTRPTTLALYENDGYGNFEDVTERTGIGHSLFGMGVAVGDYDADGWLDLFVTGVGENLLLRNVEGRRFEEASNAAGVAGASNEWSASAAWVDLNNDGWLDLFVCNYVRWARELGLELAFKLAGLGHSYGGPQVNFTGTVPYLYLNNGDGTFREVAREAGLALMDDASGFPRARSLAVAPIDLDRDGWLDLVVANHQMENFVFRNVAGERFEEVGETLLAGAARDGRSMGIDATRIGGDGVFDLGVGSFANEFNQLYRDAGDLLVFAEGAAVEREATEGALQRFGMFFFDYDLDGRADLLAVNGYLEREINRFDREIDFRRSAQLFWNGGERSRRRFFAVGPDEAGKDLFRPVVGRGAAFADMDGNGTLDVVVTQNGGRPLLLRNVGAERRNWLRIRLENTGGNRDGIGARVFARVGNRELSGRVMPTRSYLSQSQLGVTFGLGDAWKVRGLTVIWPDGERQEVDGPLEVNRELVVRR